MKAHRLLNNILILGLVIITIIALLVQSDIIPTDYFIFHMELFPRFFDRAIKYIIISGIITYFTRKQLKDRRVAEFVITFATIPLYIDAFGSLFGWYYKIGDSYSIIWYDNLAHISGIFFYNIVIYIWLRNIFDKSSKLLTALSSMFIAFGIGTLFGVTEYYSDLYFGSYMVGGLEDAITDNVYDFAGAFIGFFLIIIYEFYRFEKKMTG